MTSLTPFAELLSETSIKEDKLKTAILHILKRQQAEIADIDMMGNPVAYCEAMDIFNVNLDFAKQFVNWMELHKLGMV